MSAALNLRSGKAAAKDLEELRDYGGGAQILSALGVHDMILLTNTHHTPVALGGYGLDHRRRAADPAGGVSMARILIVEARFYEHLNDLLLAGARAAIEAAGHEHETVTVPGALEIPAAIALAAETGRYDGFVALGVVIRGETYHFEIVAGESARGIMALTLDGLAIGNGILTVENEAQALARARPDEKDKGGEAAKAAMAMMELRERLRLAETRRGIASVRFAGGRRSPQSARGCGALAYLTPYGFPSLERQLSAAASAGGRTRRGRRRRPAGRRRRRPRRPRARCA